MNRSPLTRREWMLFGFPFALLILSHLDKIRGMDTSSLSLTLNPLARARENARRSSCQSNMKQIGLGFAQYLQDYDGRFPLNSTPKQGWVYGTLPYTKSCPILFCPAELIAPIPMIPSYWMNGNLNEKGSGRGVSIHQLDMPQHTYLLGEGDRRVATSNYTLNEKTWQSKAAYNSRHLFGSNYVFADGHVKWLKPEVVNATRNQDACCTDNTFKLEIIRAKNGVMQMGATQPRAADKHPDESSLQAR